MIGYFPDPYPDELVYSIIARYHQRMRSNNYSATFKTFFGKVFFGNSFKGFPRNLTHLIDTLPPYHNYTVDGLINNHTMLPYYKLFLSDAKIKALKERMIGTDPAYFGAIRYVPLSVTTTQRFMKLCGSCVEEDRTAYGECYWHRIHQAPGVEICPRHALPLLQVKYPVSQSFQILIAEQEIKHIAIDSRDIIPKNLEVLLQLSRNIEWLFNHHNHIKMLDNDTLRKKFIFYAFQKGLSTTLSNDLPDHFKINEAFQNYYPEEVLALLNYELEVNSRSKWVRHIYMFNTKATLPLPKLLLIGLVCNTIEEFLEVEVPEMKSYVPFGLGPWPCLNQFCKYYKQLIVKEVALKRENSVTKVNTGIFQCPECEFSYKRQGPDKMPEDQFRIGNIVSYGPVWQTKFEEIWNDPSIALEEKAKLLKKSAKEIKKLVIKLGLPFPTRLKKVPTKSYEEFELNKVEEANLKEKKLEKCKETWLILYQENPNLSKSALRKMAQKDYRYLYTHAPNWLNKNSPSRNPKQPSPQNDQIFWQNQDLYYLSELNKRINVLKDSPLKWINYNSILTPLGIYRKVINNRANLPLTYQYLKENTETYEQSALRRINWGVEYCKVNEIKPTITEFLKLIHIELRKKPELQYAVRAAVNSL